MDAAAGRRPRSGGSRTWCSACRSRTRCRIGWLAGGVGTLPDDGWALAEDAFAHRDGMVTKPEVRALALARLGAPAGHAGLGRRRRLRRGRGGVRAAGRGRDRGRARSRASACGSSPTPRGTASTCGWSTAGRRRAGRSAAAGRDLRRRWRAERGALVRRGGREADRGGAGGASTGWRRPGTTCAGPATRSTAARSTRRALVDLPGGASRLEATNPVLLLWGTKR